MAPAHPEELTTFLKDKVNDELRSVIYYDEDTFELVYVRDDVRSQYSDEDLERIHQDLGLTSVGKPFLEDLYVHGELECSVHCFENAIEMHFIASETEGIAVALEPAAFLSHRTFVGQCLEKIGFEDE